MSLVVFTGGVRSGKSSAATELARAQALEGAQVVVAVFGVTEGDPEMAARVERHRAGRPANFRVLEACDSASWLSEVAEEELLLVDCVGTLVARVMAECAGRSEDADVAAEAVESIVGPIMESLAARRGDTIVVTNEVGWGVVPVYASGRVFRDVLGRVNQRLVAQADAAYLAVAGRMIDLKAASSTVSWPAD